jgi:hypothetical protein
MSDKVKNGLKELFEIAKSLAKGEDISVPEQVFQERFSICKSCPNLTKLELCGICGCAMRVKCKVATSECPDTPARWGKYEK